MATTLVHLTAEEFERLPEGDQKFELSDGVLVEVEIARAEHEFVKIGFNSVLVTALAGTEFVVAPEAMSGLSTRTSRVPDLGIWRRSELQKMDRQRTMVGGPLIAIEVVSSEPAEDLDEKLQQYFAAGTKAVWAIYPRTRSVVVERPESIERLTVRDALQAPDLIPGLKIQVADVFALLDES